MSLGRIMPLLLLSGTVAVAGQEVPKTVEKARNAVKTILQRGELEEVVRQLRADLTLGTPTPRPGNPEQLAAYLKEAMVGQRDRDVTLDHWEHPLVLEQTGPRELTLLSTGVNGERDACASKDSDSQTDDDICVSVELPNSTFR